MDWLQGLFSSGTDVSRLNPAGIAMMAAAVLLAIFADRIAVKMKPESPVQMKNAIKIIGLVICAGGTLLAILG